MSSERKDGRAFPEARTSTEETQAIQTSILCSTRYENKWALSLSLRAGVKEFVDEKLTPKNSLTKY